MFSPPRFSGLLNLLRISSRGLSGRRHVAPRISGATLQFREHAPGLFGRESEGTDHASSLFRHRLPAPLPRSRRLAALVRESPQLPNRRKKVRNGPRTTRRTTQSRTCSSSKLPDDPSLFRHADSANARAAPPLLPVADTSDPSLVRAEHHAGRQSGEFGLLVHFHCARLPYWSAVTISSLPRLCPSVCLAVRSTM